MTEGTGASAEGAKESPDRAYVREQLMHLQESALLRQAHEHFFQSWAFRGAIYLLIISAGFSMGGIFLIGNQTVNVRSELRALEAAIADSAAQLNKARAEFAAQVADRGAQVDRAANEALRSITGLVVDFEAGQDEMKVKVVATVLDELRTQLSSVQSQLREEMKATSDEFARELERYGNGEFAAIKRDADVVAKDAAELRTQLAALTDVSAQIRTLQQDVSGYEASFKGTQEQAIGLLDGLRSRADEAAEALANTAVHEKAALAQLRLAESSASDAGKAASAAAASIKQLDILEDLAVRVGNAREDLGGRAQEIDTLEGNIDAANERFSGVSGRIAEADQRVPTLAATEEVEASIALLKTRVAAMTADLDAVEPAIPDVSQPDPVADPPVLRTEESLLPGEWVAIQRRLFALGFDPRGFDGVKGPNTGAAIARYQADRGADVTEDLTSEQIADLLRLETVAEQ